MQHPAQRVGVFVDVQNMYYSARALFEQKVDFGAILEEAAGDRQLVRALAYVIRAEKDSEQSFFEALQSRGYELKEKELLTFYGGNQKGDWDIGITIDIISMCDQLDAVVLVSGDGDFAPLMEYIKGRGCLAEVMAFGSSASSQLREAADAVFDLASEPSRFLIPKSKARAKRPTGRAAAMSRANSGPNLKKEVTAQEERKPVAKKSAATRSRPKPPPVRKASTTRTRTSSTTRTRTRTSGSGRTRTSGSGTSGSRTTKK